MIKLIQKIAQRIDDEPDTLWFFVENDRWVLTASRVKAGFIIEAKIKGDTDVGHPCN